MSVKLIGFLLSSIALMVGLYFFHQRKSSGDDKETDFSNMTMFFDPFKGEGDIFVGGIIILILFSQFLLELSQTIRILFTGLT
ncbi:hypothetical protein WDW89_17835 [Deltaproteobacteria bacterium TL4]